MAPPLLRSRRVARLLWLAAPALLSCSDAGPEADSGPIPHDWRERPPDAACWAAKRVPELLEVLQRRRPRGSSIGRGTASTGVRQEGGWTFGRKGDAWLGLWSRHPTRWAEDGTVRYASPRWATWRSAGRGR